MSDAREQALHAARHTFGQARLEDLLGFLTPTTLAVAASAVGPSVTEADVRYAFSTEGAARAFDRGRFVSALLAREVATYRFADRVDLDDELGGAFVPILSREASSRRSEPGRGRHSLLLLAGAVAPTDAQARAALRDAQSSMLSDITAHRRAWIPEDDEIGKQMAYVLTIVLWGNIVTLASTAESHDDTARQHPNVAATGSSYFIRAFARDSASRRRLQDGVVATDVYSPLPRRAEQVLDAARLLIARAALADVFAFLTPTRVSAVAATLNASGHPVRTLSPDTVARLFAQPGTRRFELGRLLAELLPTMSHSRSGRALETRLWYLSIATLNRYVLAFEALRDLAQDEAKAIGRRFGTDNGGRDLDDYVCHDIVFGFGASFLARFDDVSLGLVTHYRDGLLRLHTHPA